MRHKHLLSSKEAVALIVDVQERLLPEIHEGDRVVRNIEKLLTAFEVLEVPVVATDQNRKVFGPTVAAVSKHLTEEPEDKLVFSCLGVEAVRERLGKLGRRQVIVTGFETHICVCQSALDAMASGFDVHVVADACAAHTVFDHELALEKMRRAGVIPASTESVLFELLEQAGTEPFRKLLPLLKKR